ncbi:bifunctional [glutamine synthetase] adenylyltransferase/[glutamine synthetase]-adenylyl-L-tyrosine phosphorylase [Rothia nasimurium]|uniref:bifunctional [glutamine synthetase] adenylyltransferase/[glutamine synthetase]-adenylyl-L-tyrosine phosphorylase n=3 Tax=Rothia nasimurium TaxID=85336 RepID=UPI0023516D82|nr:bifunctional [glutamine synthetase] adenylyltransferase/[glutamine synthetase]-adenylyl-L-tyrosine phosphorylase [Rothia nasimurium]
MTAHQTQTPTPDEAARRAEEERKAQLRLISEMAAIGFYDAAKSARWLNSRELEGIDRAALFEGLRLAPSPDIALPALVRLIERAPHIAQLAAQGARAEALYRLLGGSEALSEFLIRHPEHTDLLDPDRTPELSQDTPSSLLPDTDGDYLTPIAPLNTAYRTDLLTAVGADPTAPTPVATLTGKDGYTALRVAYRRAITHIAIKDLTSFVPVQVMPTIGRHLADLAAAALEGALAIARAEVSTTRNPLDVEAVDLAIIGMGKCGARELNYISDVDVVYAVAHKPLTDLPDDFTPLTENHLTQIGTELVHALSKAIMAPAPEPALWEVDANLRPEGKDGALVRTIDSYTTYYKRWAENWEFQALLKARPIAGTPDLGVRWARAMRPFVWESAARESFVESVQAMRRRVTDNIPAAEVDRQIKLGPGGLRDVEFTVQLLQLVHGRTDETVRTQTTTDSITALAKASYIGRADAQDFAENYATLRVMEHRIQLLYMRRTHLMPAKENDRRALARALSSPVTNTHLTEEDMLKQWASIKRAVKSLHERLFFRPLLAAVAHLSKDEVALTPQAAQDRLAALGYKDPRRAMGHIEALTKGLRRSAEIQRTLMPVLLGWFAQGVDPDAGLLGFRRVSESLGGTPWYLRMLRDSPAAAERLCTLLASSRFISDLLEDVPDPIAWLDKAEDLKPRETEVIIGELRSHLTRHPETAEAIRAVRMARRREILRLAMGEALGLNTNAEVAHGLSDIDQGAIRAALAIATRELYTDGREPLTDLAVIAMGRQGGAEIGYGSDSDLMYVHIPRPGADEKAAQAEATDLINRMVALLKQPTTPPIRAEKVLEIDADLRPEGKAGAMVRSLDSFREYYERWADTWEFQALLRARPFAGSDEVGQAFVDLIAPYRYPETFGPEQVTEIRRMKARVENERMPRGADKTRQLKLGRGGLTDVEWLVQLLQLQHAHRVEGIRTTSTLKALRAAAQEGLLPVEDAELLESAWKLASKIRGLNVLRTGRASDTLTTTRPDLEAIARWCGYPPNSARLLEDDYLRITRQARAVYEKHFYPG